jgi:arsenite/tail-anchored protein-transporting ATPase
VETSWITDSRVVMVAGKGGVGSSTVAAALALAAARQGANVLVISVDGRPGLGPLLGGLPLSGRDQVLRTVGSGRIRGRTIPPAQAFNDYLELRGVNAVMRKAATSASLPAIAASTPGLEHLLVLGKIKELEREKAADLIVVDCPPAGHAAAFLRAASALQEVVASGPVRTQADDVAAMLADRSRCQGLLVTLPEVTPVNEVIELAYDIEDRLGVSLAPLVVNACWQIGDRVLDPTPAASTAAGKRLSAGDCAALDATAAFGRARLRIQNEQLDRLREVLPLPLVTLRRFTTARFGHEELEIMADELEASEAS